MKANVLTSICVALILLAVIINLDPNRDSTIENEEAESKIRFVNEDVNGEVEYFFDFGTKQQWWKINKDMSSPIIRSAFYKGKDYRLHVNQSVSFGDAPFNSKDQ